MQKRILMIISVFCFLVFEITTLSTQTVFAQSINKYPVQIADKNLNTNSDKLLLIDKYQAEYFRIIKRNNVLLNLEEDKALNKDRKELKKLYKEVKKQISNKTYLKEYSKIERKFSKCDDMTDIGMKEFSINNYNEIEDLLNKVYKEVKSKIPSEDFKNLTMSEQNWIKEVKNYEKIYNSMDYGTIGTVIYYDYQINMRNFRTLLLMLYL